MPQAVRIQDICTGHDCHPPRPVTEGSFNVFFEKRGAVNNTHLWMVHECEEDVHPGFGASSQTVFVNGSPAMAVGDPINCGSFCMTGANTVFIGG